LIEQAMFFALGVLVAGLLGLMILPALWRRAVRLSTRRLEMQTPLSMDEVLADRDLLRAEFAVAERRLEERLAHERDARARERADLGRKTAALITQGEALAALRSEHLQIHARLAETHTHAIDLQAQLGAAMVEVHDGLSAREKYEALGLDLKRLQHLANDRQLVIAGLETRLAGVEAKLRDAQRALAEREQVLVARQTVLDRLNEERERARTDLAHYSQTQMGMRTEIDARERRVAELEDALAAVNRKLAAAERKRGSAILPEDDAGLRTSIADLGAEVLRIAQAIEGRAGKQQEAKPQEEEKPQRQPRKRAAKNASASVE
jgi:predicted  nucleic acid-binding Zn-ribbon protein